jgi:hypothetical protein
MKLASKLPARRQPNGKKSRKTLVVRPYDTSMNKVMNEVSIAPPPNFISDIFYLNIAMSHYGYLRTIQTYSDLQKHIEDIQRHLDYLNGDGSWMGV